MNNLDKIIYDGWIKLKQVHYKGRPYEIVKGHDAVAAIIIDAAKNILLVGQYRVAARQHTFEIPAGILDISGEHRREAMVRELKEETKLDISIDQLHEVSDYYQQIGHCEDTITVFFAQLNTTFDNLKTLINDDDNVEIAQWIPFVTFEEWIHNGRIVDAKTILAYYYIKSL